MNYDDLVTQLIHARVKINNLPCGETMFFDSKGEAMVMGYLAHEKKQEQPSVLAEKCLVSTARIASILNSLEKKELIIRTSDATDARKINVSLTEKGLNLTKIKDKQIFEDMKNMLQALGEDDAKNHVRIMERISEYLVHAAEGKNHLC